jgi:4-hydroxy-tetrahydrodipicolinate reductase
MGKMIEALAQSRDHEIVMRIGKDTIHEFTSENLKKADVAIEFTSPDSAFDNVTKCLQHGLPVVSGSTGWNNQLNAAKEICLSNNTSFIHASNFSIGVNIFFEVNKFLARLMNTQKNYDVSIEELHHTEKKDAPSGTAVSLAEQVMANVDRKTGWINEQAASPEQISIISKRVDPAPGTHYVKYSSEIDEIEIVHTAHSRKGFALGAIMAAEFILGKKGVFTMSDVLQIGK